MEPVVSKASKESWGPLLWRLFHCIAEVSDRRDIPGYWRTLLVSSAGTLPCALCRNHFGEYLRTHSMATVKNPYTAKGDVIREKIRNEIWAFHNHVNQNLGKPEFKYEDLATEYGIRTRQEILLEIQQLFDSLQEAWNPLMSINQTAYKDWKKSVAMLIALTKAGPM